MNNKEATHYGGPEKFNRAVKSAGAVTSLTMDCSNDPSSSEYLQPWGRKVRTKELKARVLRGWRIPTIEEIEQSRSPEASRQKTPALADGCAVNEAHLQEAVWARRMD